MKRINGKAILRATSRLEDKCDKRTVKSLPKMGKKAPLCYEYLGQLIMYAELIGTCAYVASHRPQGNKAYEQFFGPMSKKVWSELQKMWAGKSSLMDVIRAEQENK